MHLMAGFKFHEGLQVSYVHYCTSELNRHPVCAESMTSKTVQLSWSINIQMMSKSLQLTLGTWQLEVLTPPCSQNPHTTLTHLKCKLLINYS